jgi:type IV pilus assembly protein PilB
MNTHNAETLLTILDPELIQRYRVIPLKLQGTLLKLGVVDPADQNAINAIIFHTGLRVIPSLITENQFNDFLKNFCEGPAPSNQLQKMVAQDQISIQESNTDYAEPLIKFVDHLIQHAIAKAASDIHIEPYENQCRIRYRQDGILYEISAIKPALANRLITRLKVMAGLNISERRLPQDGRFQVATETTPIDIRMNTCPMLNGEKIVLRILDARKLTLALEGLGMSDDQMILFEQKISAPQGCIIVTGPTGSGKTLTLYSALNYLNTTSKNISTVEDPVEIHLSGINQVSVHAKIGLTFAATLRTFLRQDPDVIMLGEIRDLETATIAMQAAHTGHLVLSTLHSNHALSACTRLHTLGVAGDDLRNANLFIVAQRLLRKLCSLCKQIVPGQTSIFRARGCEHCLQGYAGRTAIYEMLDITPDILQHLYARYINPALCDYLPQSGFINLQQSAMQLVTNGITSTNEMQRVLRNFTVCD